MEIFLFRHGKTSANEKNLYCGKSDISLSESGIEELQESLRQGGVDLSDFVIYSSPMKRVAETVKILYPQALSRVIFSPDFSEINFGDFEMHSYQELKDSKAYQEWIGDCENNIPKNPCPNGESWNQMKMRVIPAFEALLEKKENFALFTHAGVISIIMNYLFPEEGKAIYEWKTPFGKSYKIIMREGEKRASLYEKIGWEN